MLIKVCRILRSLLNAVGHHSPEGIPKISVPPWATWSSALWLTPWGSALAVIVMLSGVVHELDCTFSLSSELLLES